MKLETQILVLENMLSSDEVFSRCIPILNPEYFSNELRPAIKFMVDYYDKYHSKPNMEYINAEYELSLKTKNINRTEIQFTCDQIELFCKQGALYKAIIDSAPDVTSGNYQNFGKILDRVQSALAVSIQRDIGIEMYSDIESRLKKYLDTDVYISTGIKALDAALNGGIARRQMTLFTANSGGGKSLMMSNIGANFSKAGYHVLQLALELSEQMIDLRNIAILTGVKISDWKNNMNDIVSTIKEYKNTGVGSFTIKRLPGGSTANDIRAFLKVYETERGHKPDLLIVDYLDLMQPNGGVRNKSVYEQDKEKSEQLAEIAFDYDCAVVTASQQNRSGIKNPNPDQSIIAGGISKINTVDNCISIYMNPEMRLKGQCFLYFLKTRSSTVEGSMIELTFNPDNLIISDKRTTPVNILQAIKERKKNNSLEDFELPGLIEGNETTTIPSEFSDIILEYDKIVDTKPKLMNNNEESKDEYKEDEVLDLEDDDQIWSKPSKKFVVKNDDYDDIYEDEILSIIDRI